MHNPFKPLELADKPAAPAPAPSDYPKHVYWPDGSYKVARNAEEEAEYSAQVPAEAPKKGGFLAKLGLK